MDNAEVPIEKPNSSLTKRSKSTKPTDDETMAARIKEGQRFVERGMGERDRIACKRFLDGSESAAFLLYDDDNYDGVGVLPEASEVGNVNYLAINILTKTASVAIGDPDFYVNCGEDYPDSMGVNPQFSNADFSEVVRLYLKGLWKQRRWARTCRKALLKRSVSGCGIIAYLWHDTLGPVIEHVRPRDLSIDPHIKDWNNPRWAARRILLPFDDARERFGNKIDLATTEPSDILNLDAPGPITKNTVELWLYYDKNTEAILHGSTVLEKGPNLYKRIPVLFLEGDIAPESEFSLSDYDLAAQIQEQLTRYQSMLNNQAESGGAIGWFNPMMLDDSSKEAFANGRPQGFVALKADAEDAFGFIPGEPLSQALLEAIRMTSQGLDSATGVSEYERGVINQSAKFATEAALLANKSGARGNQAQIEYEQFIDLIAKRVLEITLMFAPSLMGDGAPDDMLLLQAIGAVQDVAVIESSTSYKDPSQERQSNMQLLQALMPFIQAGIVDPAPVIADLLRSFGKRDVGKYLKPAPMAQPGQPGNSPLPGQPGQPGMPPGVQNPGGAPNSAGQPGQVMSAPPPPPPAAPVTINPSLVTIHQHNGSGKAGVK